jgi:hypothetical protein
MSVATAAARRKEAKAAVAVAGAQKDPRAVSRDTLRQLQLAFRVALPLIVVLGAVAFFAVVYKGSNVVTLSVDNSEKLRDVLFGGQPWIILCSNFKSTLRALHTQTHRHT